MNPSPVNNILIIIGATLALMTCPLHAGESPRTKIKRFVQQVILEPEFGSNRKVAARWTAPPALSVFGATPEEKAVVEEVVRTINPSLKPAIGEIQLLPDSSETATIKVYFALLHDFAKIARRNNATYKRGNWGYFWMFWDDKNAITSTIVLLASDKLAGNQLKHFAFEENTQSLGLAEDSDEFRDSIFYSRGGDGGDATRPSPLDLQVLAWFYQQIQPGDNRKAVSEKFDKTWKLTN
jgi:hypothetical protein